MTFFFEFFLSGQAVAEQSFYILRYAKQAFENFYQDTNDLKQGSRLPA